MMTRTRAVVAGCSCLLSLAAGCAKTDPSKDRFKAAYLGASPTAKNAADAAPAETPKILPQTHYAAGRLFESQGQIGKAIEQYRKAVAVNHDYVEAYYRLGRMYSIAGQHDESLAALARAVELAPKNAAYRNDLGFQLMHQKRWAEAEHQIRQAVALQPKFARAYVNLGLVLSRAERFDEALEAFRQVLPEPDAQYNMGLMYRGQKQYAAAADAFRRVLEISPDFPAARVQLDQLADRAGAAADSAEERLAYMTDEEYVEPDDKIPSADPAPPASVEPTLIQQPAVAAAADENDSLPERVIEPVPVSAEAAAVAAKTGDEADAQPRQTLRDEAGCLPPQAFVEDLLKEEALDHEGHPKTKAVVDQAGADRGPAAQPQDTGSGQTEPLIFGEAGADSVPAPSTPPVEAREPQTEWEGLRLSYKQLREILENDADCEAEAMEKLVADADVSPVQALSEPPSPVTLSPERPTVLAEFARTANALGRSEEPGGLPFGTEPVGPIFLESSKPILVMGPPGSPTDAPGFRTVADRIGPSDMARPDAWRAAFNGLAALASRSENDFHCWREFGFEDRGRVVYTPWPGPGPALIAPTADHSRSESTPAAGPTFGSFITPGRSDAGPPQD